MVQIPTPDERTQSTPGRHPPKLRRIQDSRSPPPNYFARKEQFRLLIMCSMLMLVLVMMNEVRKPETWDWMWAGEQQPQTQQAVEQQGSEQAMDQLAQAPIDTRAEDQRKSNVPANAFRVEKPRGQRDEISGLPEDKSLPGINAQLLASIEDNSILRVAENDAWQTILQILSETSQTELVSRSLGTVSFAQLFRQTESYRGRVVSVRGTIRRAERITTRENENSIDELFRWIVEPAGPSNSPIVIYSLEKPTAFMIGDNVREDATFTGVYFKRWAYAAGDGTRIAPLLLAKTATWEPTPPPKPVELPNTPIVTLTLIGLVALAAGIAMFVYRNSKAKHPDVERAREYMSQGVDQLDSEPVLPPVQESLRQLSEMAKQHSAEHGTGDR